MRKVLKNSKNNDGINKKKKRNRLKNIIVEM